MTAQESVLSGNRPIEETQPSDLSSADADVAQLQASAANCGLTISDESAQLLVRYGRLLWDWNSRLNLTRHTDWELFVTRDLLDTFELAKHLPENSRVMDIGSGGGVPGIPLALIRPDLQVSLCDSVGKKAMALKDMVTVLGLPIVVHSDRAEKILKSKKVNFITARAVASISKLMTWLKPVWNSVGQLYLIKGPRWVEENAEAEADGHFRSFRLEQISSWSTPGRDGQSVLLNVTRRKQN